jgi:glycosyltransferase involved in cell wall biosynthesis
VPDPDLFSISVVVPTRNRFPHLLRRLPLWVEAGFDEIIIVDGSYDTTIRRQTENLCRKFGAKYVSFPRTLRDTRARQRNTGVTAATSEWILFQDDDDTVPLGVSKSVLREASRGADWLIGAAGEHIILHRRASFLAFGGYPEDMVAAEDIIMSNRCRGHGKGALVGPWHERQVSPGQPREDPISRARNAFWYGVTVIIFLLRTPLPSQALVGDLWRVGGFVRSALHGEAKAVVYLMCGLTGRALSPLHTLYLLVMEGRGALAREDYHDWQGLRS